MTGFGLVDSDGNNEDWDKVRFNNMFFVMHTYVERERERVECCLRIVLVSLAGILSGF